MAYPFTRQQLLVIIPLNSKGFNLIPNASIDSRWFIGDGEQFMTKAKMLQNQSKNMATMASHFASTSKIQDAFLVGKVGINNAQKKKIKINNLKVA
jgi:hypothetical protein